MEILFAFNQFHSRKCFSQFRCPAILQRNGGNFICFQSVSFEKMLTAIPQWNNRNFICFQSVSLKKIFPHFPVQQFRNSTVEQRKFYLLSISSTRENVSRNSAVPQFRSGTTEVYLLSISFDRENVSRNSAVPQFRSGTTEILFAFNQFHSRKCFPQFCCPARDERSHIFQAPTPLLLHALRLLLRL